MASTIYGIYYSRKTATRKLPGQVAGAEPKGNEYGMQQ